MKKQFTQGSAEERKLIKTLNRATGAITAYDNTGEFCSYSGFAYQSPGYFMTVIHDFCSEKAEYYKVSFAKKPRELNAKLVNRDPNTGISLFEIEEQETVIPLPINFSPDLTAKKFQVLAQIGSIGMKVEQVIVGEVVEVLNRDSFCTNLVFDERYFGLPVLDSSGCVIGIVTDICRLSKKRWHEEDFLERIERFIISDEKYRELRMEYLKDMTTINVPNTFPKIPQK